MRCNDICSLTQGLDNNRCKSTEIGLIAPDIVFQLNIDPKEAAARAGYGKHHTIQIPNNTIQIPTKLCLTVSLLNTFITQEKRSTSIWICKPALKSASVNFIRKDSGEYLMAPKTKRCVLRMWFFVLSKMFALFRF